MKRLKRIGISALVLMLFCVPVGALAAETPTVAEDEVVVETVYYDDGSYGVVTLSIPTEISVPGARSVKTTHGKKSYTHYNSKDVASWKYTITGYFRYTGSSATATSVNETHEALLSSWKLQSESSYCSGNQAIGKISYKHNSTVASRTLTVTCSKSGHISTTS